jgi:prolyl oligopeptidase
LTTKQFVSGGFTLPEAKSHTAWEDENTVLVGTDFGEGSLTDSRLSAPDQALAAR